MQNPGAFVVVERRPRRLGPFLPVLIGLWALLMLLCVACSGPPMPVSKSGASRAEEASRLRKGLPSTPSGKATKRDVKAAADTSKDATSSSAGSALGRDDEGREEGGDKVAAPVIGDSLVLGEFALLTDKPAILDGDTIKVQGLDASLRLVGIDSEETFKKEKDRKAAAGDFEGYMVEKRGTSKFPVKAGTPMGEEAKRWAEDFFSGQATVRLELDDLHRIKGVFGRYLVYVFVKKGGTWVNYNVEAVRAGMSPYFVKYGYSRRFHEDFVKAQDEARAAKRGIWGSSIEHYPDYEERLVWWKRRADAIVTFEAKHYGKPDVVQLGNDDDWAKLAGLVDKSVTIFGTLGEMKLDKSPYLVQLSHKRSVNFSLVAFELTDIEKLQLDRYDGDYVYVRGKLSQYRDIYQFKVADIEKIWTE